ncbi:hypothetical protein C672_3084 [[Clostridium] bifermentans ATCC 638]|uniref:Uncharacterized protein n=1 Tax=Paraclostridium bifermentans ATCC 638 = DSM 14991 TaxID=1233171 RepID=T4VIM0_PARBF|nr:hypothetical protein C672_3084 [[Clostridium] bifermentans ATCC 638] [Paraclostridium bifermentans ATCC 638 = DSM 14991]
MKVLFYKAEKMLRNVAKIYIGSLYDGKIRIKVKSYVKNMDYRV